MQAKKQQRTKVSLQSKEEGGWKTRRRRKPPGTWMNSLFLAFICSLFLMNFSVNSQSSPPFQSVTVSQNPKTVGAESVLTYTLRLNSPTTFNNGDILLINFPTRGSFNTLTTPTCNSVTIGITVSACVLTTSTAKLTLAVTSPQNRLSVTVSNFKNPSSTTSISDMGATLQPSTGSISKAVLSNGIMDGFTEDAMQAASIMSLNTQIAAEGVQVKITFRPKNTLKTNGRVQVFFPYWNPDGNQLAQLNEKATLNCKGTAPMKTTISCSYNVDSRLLTLLDPVTADTSQVDLTFTVDNFRNPYSAKPRTGYTIVTLDNVGGRIDSSAIAGITMTLSNVVDWANFQSVSVQRTDTLIASTIVGALSNLQFNFYLGFPMDAGCRIEITFPSDMPITNDLTSISAGSVTSNNAFSKDISNNKMTIDGCPGYLTATLTDISIEMRQVKNKGYVQETNSFSIVLYATDSNSNQYAIAKKTIGITLPESQFSMGSIASLKVAAAPAPDGTSEIQKQTMYVVTIKPGNSMDTSSKLSVQFPTSISLVSGTCTVKSPTSPVQTSAGCSVAANTVTLTTPFGSGKYTEGGAAFSFIFSTGGINPTSAKNAGIFTVTTYRMINGVGYGIDTGQFDNVYTPDPSNLIATVSDVSSKEAYYSPSSYTLKITPLKQIPQNGIITIEFPPEITLVGSTVETCTYTISGKSTTSNSIITVVSSPSVMIRIEDVFTLAAYTTTNVPFTIQCNGFKNPRTTATTGTFKIYTYDSLGYALEKGDTGITVKMETTPDLIQFDVGLGSVINGATNSYTITFISQVPHVNNDVMSFKFPPEITLPSTLNCQIMGLITAITCTKVGTDGISAKMTFAGSTEVIPGTRIQFQIQNIKNPPDTRFTSSFTSIKISDSSGLQLTQFTGSRVIQTTDFAEAAIKSLTQTSQALGALTDYMITYTTVNKMPTGAAFRIEYIKDVTVTSITKCQLKIGTTTYTMSSCTVDSGNSYIYVSAIPVDVAAGTSISITLGDIGNPRTQSSTIKSFVLQSYTDNTLKYKIDKISSGLVPQFECDFPCKTCNSPTSRTECLSCQIDIITVLEKFLYNKQCLTACPDGTYSDSNTCKPCKDMCKTCSNYDTCTSCKPESTLPFLYQGSCVGNCPLPLCPINFECKDCTAPGFLSVKGEPTPSTVNSGSYIRFTVELDPTLAAFQNGDTITFAIPSPGAFTPTTSPSACSSVTAGIEILQCTIYSGQAMLKLQVGQTGITKAIIQVGNFINPPTTADITGVQIYLVDALGDAKSVVQNEKLGGFTAATMTGSTLLPSSFVVGASGLTLTTTFQTVNTFKTSFELHMQFPIWNPLAAQQLSMITAANPTCKGLTPAFMPAVLTCTFNSATHILTITSPITAELPGGTALSFSVDNFQNPYNGKPKTDFYISIYDPLTHGETDRTSSLSVTATEFAQLLSPTLARADNIQTVSEGSSFTSGFQLNLPIDAKCTFRVVFPSDMPISLSLYTAIGTNFLENVDSINSISIPLNYMDVIGCDTFIEATQANTPTTLSYAQVNNIGWVKQSGVFVYELYAFEDGVNYKIAQTTDTTLVITESMLKKGSLSYFKIETVDTAQSGVWTRFRITILPVHIIRTDNKIKIKFPTAANGANGIALAQATKCILTQSTGGIAQQSAICSADSTTNTLTISNAFGQQDYLAGNAFSFIFSTGGINPQKACSAGDFEVSTYRTIGGIDYPIDYRLFTNSDPSTEFVPYIPDASTLTASMSSISVTEASSTAAVYTFLISPQKVIPANSKIQLTLPTTVGVITSGQVSCTANGITEPKVVSTSAPIVIVMERFFSSDYSSKTPFQLACTGFINPRNKISSDSFRIDIQDSQGCAIETAKTGVTVTMATVPSFNSIKASAGSTTNGASGTYTITVNPSIRFVDGDVLYLTFPVETSVPASVTCSVGTNVKTVSCSSSSPNQVKVVLTFTTGSVAANNDFTFIVNNVKNAPSTKTTSPFTNIRAYDKDGNDIAIFTGTGPTITNTQPAIATGTLTQADLNTNKATEYTIKYTTVNKMESGSTFLVEYPSIVTVPSTFSTCSVNYGPALTMSCSVNAANKYIKITSPASGGIAEIAAGTTVTIKLSPITNPATQVASQTFRLTSFTDDTQQNRYDQVNQGLNPQYQCDLPCATCSPTNKKSCLTCYTNEPSIPQKYLNGTSCLSDCPAGFYEDNFQCKACQKECSTCDTYKNCTACKTDATSQFKYFFNSWCYSQCPDTYYADSSNQCRPCDSNCQTCGGSATTCTSCQQNSNFPLLSKSQCVSKCDNGFTSINFQCQQCKSPCASCVTTLDTCQSCLTGFLLGTKCLAQCPSGYTTDNKKCIGCDPRCEKCSPTDATRCLQCQTPLVLLNNTCISKCPDGYKVDSQNIVCQQVVYVPGGGTGGTGTGTGGGSGNYLNGEDMYVYKNNKTYTYFVTQIAQTVTGGVGVGSYFRNKIQSPWSSNVIGLWSPIETASFGAQAYLAYDQLDKTDFLNFTANQTNSTSNSTSNSTTKLYGRSLLEISQMLTSVTDGIIPLVFYGTCFSLIVNFLCNFLFALFFLMIMRKDPGYQEFVKEHSCHPYSLLIFGTLFSFKMHKFFYSTFWGSYQIPFRNPEKIRNFFNILTTLNIIFSLTPVILIDVYGLSKYKWGSQFYIMQIETLIFALSMIAIQIIEFRRPKTDNPYDNAYASLDEMGDKIDEEVKRRLAQALEDYAKRLKADRDGDKNLRRTKSMCDIGDREKEEDTRRVNTDPLDHKRKKIYDDRMNPYHQVLDHDYPDNCYAEVGRNLQKNQDPQGKVQQTGQRVQTGDEYDRDYDSRMRMLNQANLRNDQRLYGVNQGEDDDETAGNYKRRKNMRGRKGKYYSQVDDEDQTFLEQERRLIDGEEDVYGDDDPDKLENSIRKVDDDTKLLSKNTPKNQTSPKTGGAKKLPNGQSIPEAAEEHEDEHIPKKKTVVPPTKGVKQSVDKSPSKQSPKVDSVRKSKVEVLKEQERNADEDDILDDKEVVMNQRVKNADGGGGDISARSKEGGAGGDAAGGKFSRLKSTEDIRKEIEKMSKKLEETQPPQPPIEETAKESDPSQSDNEKGQPDSDNEEDKRLENMRDAEKRRFNVNDILGDFDRDERGHPLILQDKKGELIDKSGNRVNEKGYLVDPKTGDILEREKGRKVFSSSELDERGELPPPFNLERYNFNAHDVRGFFDKDPNGEDILKGLKKDKQGFLLDKLGRRVNEHGYLIDMYGNLCDKRGRTKLHKHIMEQNGGEIPQLFTYKGKKFDLQDVMGALDKDRKGNIIIRRDGKGRMVDKKGRLVNEKGYLVDPDGNVINKEGKVMFENFTLTKDGEIPKLFPFLKFNIDEVKGDYEMDPLGIPILQKTRDGSLVDSKGRRVNSKGYLIDAQGNVVNKRGGIVFNRKLLEDDGEIPKVFRAGLLRKDTYDSFSQLMSEIEDLERLQEMEENNQVRDPRLQEKLRRRMEKENERMQKKIDKIVDGEGEEDDGMLMRELEELAKGDPNAPNVAPGGGRNNATGRLSDGGNTSVDSMMEDTPSNYNALNQRFVEVENVKNKARKNIRGQQQVMENAEEDEDASEYSYMPDRKMRKKKKKKKKKKRADGTIDERELMMAKAYGGLSQNQYDKLVALRRLQQSQLPGAARVETAHSQVMRTPSNMGQSVLQGQRFSRAGMPTGNETTLRFNEDQKSEWGESQVEGGRAQFQAPGKPPVGGQSISRQKYQGNSTSRIVVANKPAFRSNNLMGSTQRSGFNLDGSEDANNPDRDMSGTGPQFNNSQHRIQRHAKSKGLIDQQQQLANVANSVSGFYKDGGAGASDHQSNMSRTQDNFAANIHNPRRTMMGQAATTNDGGPQGSPREGDGTIGDYQRVYGTAKGLDPNGMPMMLGDDLSEGEGWERGSHRSGRSQMSQFSQVNHMKVKGLETIYLQRLEPATKGGRKAKKGQDKARFRVMHHKYHDEPEWHVDDRDELDSIISGNYKEMQKKFEEEFQGSSQGTRSKRGTRPGGHSSRGGAGGSNDGINLFTGNLKQYKEIGK